MALIPLALVAASGSVGAQDPARDVVAEVGRNLRENGSSGRAVRILRQEESGHSQAARDQIADSLTALVMAYQPGGTVSLRVAEATRGALAAAGADGRPGTPYPRAAALLYRIAVGADEALRAGALSALSRQSDKPVALEYLRRAAMWDDGFAHVAVSLLGRHAGADGRMVLRTLHGTRLVRNEQARTELAIIARNEGW
ncbi:MAG TPA: hypothetical protein VEB19_07810 [Gemmatimonadaceae bacterium]|nr:hypothetical protein [Gemmatimonadaceae bacterium]